MCTLILLLLTSRPISVVTTNMDHDTIQDLMTPNFDLSEGCGYDNCPGTADDMLNIHIVPHTHGELGDTRHFQQYYTGKIEGDPTPTNINMKKIIDFVTTQLWEKESRKFTLYDTPYLFHWWSRRDDTVHRMVYQLLRQGRLHIVGGGWGMPDSATTSYHALIDHFTYGLRKLNRTLGPCARPLVAWQADVFGHSREFASLATQLAFDGLFINPISFEDEVQRMLGKELEVVWRGSDDLGPSSDMFTHKLFDGYWSPPGFCFARDCNDSLIVHSESLFRNYHERVSEFIDAAKNRQGGNYATNHVMIVMGKRMAYYDANQWFENIDVLIDKVNEQSIRDNEKVHAFYSTPACYLRAVHATGTAFPPKQDDFMSISYDKLTHFTGHFTSRPTIKYMAREAHVYLQMAKQLYVLANLSPKKLKLYDDLSWINGVFQDHGIITGAMVQQVCDHYTMKMYNAVQKSTVLLQNAFNKLRRSSPNVRYFRCAFNISSCRNTNSLRSYVVVYNPLAWPVTVPVRLPVVRHSRFIVYNHKMATVRSVMMKIPPAVLYIPYRDTRADHEIVFLAEKLPPMGYRSYYIESVTVAPRNKRSIVKKLRTNKKKKYFARQTDQMKIDDKSMLDTLEHKHYDYGDEDEDDEEDETYDRSIGSLSITDTQHSTPDSLDIPFTDNVNISTDGTFDKPEFSYDKPDFTYNTPDVYEKHAEGYENYVTSFLDLTSTTGVTSTAGVMSTADVMSATIMTSTLKPSDEDEDMPFLRVHSTPSSAWAPGYLDPRQESTTARSNKTEAIVVPSDDEAEHIERRKFFDTSPLNRTSSTPPPVRTTTTERYYDGYNDPDLDEDRQYFYRTSVQKFIRNKYVKVHLDHSNLPTRVTLSNGIQMALNIQFYYYVSDDPMKLGRAGEKRPGHSVFRPMDPAPVKILDHLHTTVSFDYQLTGSDIAQATLWPKVEHACTGKELALKRGCWNTPLGAWRQILHNMKVVPSEAVHKTYLVEEVQYSVADWLGFVVRVYAERPVVEVDWVVGPVPVHDQLGKEIFVRYSTDVVNDGVFYTDSNGRQTIKRIRNRRPGYNPVQTNIPSNIYPVTSKIYIEDPKRNIRVSIFNDRSQGGTSLHDGQIDLMLHRRIFTNENFGSPRLNETEHGRGIMVRGKHYLYVSKADYKPNRIFEKKFAKEVELSPQVFACPFAIYGTRMKEVWSGLNNEFRGVLKKLPIGVHVLTLQEWNDGNLLLRLENYLEKSDIVQDGVRTVFVKDLFANIIITGLRETTLGGNVWREDYTHLRWNLKDKFVKNFNEHYGNNDNDSVNYDNSDLLEPEAADIVRGIKLRPQQIRTFVIAFERVGT